LESFFLATEAALFLIANPGQGSHRRREADGGDCQDGHVLHLFLRNACVFGVTDGGMGSALKPGGYRDGEFDERRDLSSRALFSWQRSESSENAFQTSGYVSLKLSLKSDGCAM